MEKKRILFWGDTPTCATGFATVSRNVLKELHKTGLYDIDIIGINATGAPYDQEEFPYLIYPAASALSQDPKYKNVYGMQLFIDFARSGNYDIVYIIQDTFIVHHLMPALLQVEESLEKKFNIVYYFPIDASPKKEWVKEVVSKVDFPVAYTKYAKAECEAIDPNLYKMPIVYHGVDKKTFFPIINKDEVRKKFFEEHAEKFIVLNVSRNQPRKDLSKTFAAFSIFHKKHPKSFLYILAQSEDVGGDLIELAKHYGLEFTKGWACPPPGTYGANKGWSVETVNQIYNSSDLVISTTLGEGFGLSTVEAMACKVPLLVPKNTSLVEIIGEKEERGYFCKSGANLNDFCFQGMQDNNVLRPTVDAYDMAERMEYIMQNYDEAVAKAELAYMWAKTWEEIGEDWKKIFAKAGQKKK